MGSWDINQSHWQGFYKALEISEFAGSYASSKILSKVLFRSGEYPAVGLHSSPFSTYLHEKPLLIFLFILGNESNSTRRSSWSCHTHEISWRPSAPRNKNKQRRTKGSGAANKNTSSEQERLHAFLGYRSLIYPQFQQFYLKGGCPRRRVK